MMILNRGLQIFFYFSTLFLELFFGKIGKEFP